MFNRIGGKTEMDSEKYKRPRRPVLRYHGGKFKIAPWIVSHFPDHQIYAELFGGAGSVLLAKPRSPVEIFNEIDGFVVNLFEVLRDIELSAKLERQLRLTPFARDELKIAQNLDVLDPVEKARRTVVRAFQGHAPGSATTDKNLQLRGIRKGGKAGPATDWQNWPDVIKSLTARLQGVVIESVDALKAIKRHDDKEALFYIDPPYPANIRASKNDYRVEMTDDDHRDLAEALHTVKGMVCLSGYSCDLYDDLFSGWNFVERKTRGQGQKGGSVNRVERLWFNSVATQKLEQAA